MIPRWVGTPWLAVVLIAGSAVPGSGQEGMEAVAETLRAAARHETAGELAEAESLLVGILDEEPASVPALLALERVLRIQGRLDELVPLVERGIEADRGSALLNQLRVRTYSRLDRVPALERAAREWIEAVPRIGVAYREVARAWESRGQYNRALDVLAEGRRRIGRPDALALPMGDLFAVRGDYRRAVEEWARAVDPEGRGLVQVQQRLRPLAGTRWPGEMVDRLAREGASSGRLMAALELALQERLEDRVRVLVDRVLPTLHPSQQELLLNDVARRADRTGHRRLAFWAYGLLLDVAEGRAEAVDQEGDGGSLLVIRNRRAELALALGDTAAAASGYESVERAFDQGSPQRRAAAALRIELMAAQDINAALEAVERFREDHGDVPELDRLAATVAGALARAGRPEEAAALLADVSGPRSAVQRGRLLLARGEMDAAREEYIRAAPELRGADATRVLRLVTLLTRVSERAGARVAEALRLRDAGRPAEAVGALIGGGAAVGPGDVAPLLDFAAGLADAAGLVEEARGIRRRIVAEHPRSTEAPSALLALGRDLGADAETRDQAREYLERLIVEYPRSALVPQARRALERLEDGGVA